MKIRIWLAALVALALALPGALGAQDRRGDEGRAGSGYMGILFGWDDDGTASVRDVIPESPAARAGVRRGDVVVRLNGRAPTEDAVDALREGLKPGDTVRLTVRRDGREEQHSIVAAARRDVVFERLPREGPGGVFSIPPGDRRIVIRLDTIEAHVDSMRRRMDSLRVRLRERRQGDSLVIHVDSTFRILRDSLVRVMPRVGARMRDEISPFFYEFGMRSMGGAEFAEMNPGLGKYFHTNEGLLVLQVAPQTPSARAGLQPGDVVVEAGGRRVARVGDLREAFTRADGQEVRLTVLRDGRRQQVQVRWERPREMRFRVDSTRERARGERVRVEVERERARP
ncbi:MAG TPA: PDZ domain-containing protein [Longimicrobium sp.]|nr:PDZ domain-containing protein [Longimicrobium sp.]